MDDTTSRQHRRHLVNAECEVRSAIDGRLLADRTLDVSWSGLRVLALDEARLDERVRVTIRIPRSRTWIEADGRVERVLGGRREGDEGPALGISLRRMDGMLRLLLASVIERYPEAACGRGFERDYARAIARIAEAG